MKPFAPPRLHVILVCNKTDIAPCSLLTAEAVAKAGLPFVAVSARNQINTRHLYRLVRAATKGDED
jgi:50S ribosomal subunit-associated GTPase HflX